MFSTPSPLRAALLAQILGGIAAAALIQIVYPQLFSAALASAVLQGVCAALIGRWLGAPTWWLPIHCAFMPAVVLASRLHIASGWYLTALVVLILIFWRTDQSRVPLYLSNAATTRALAALLPAAPSRVIDLGCAHGGLLRRLARARSDCRFVGIEHAPLPWLWAKLASLGLPNLDICYGNFWGRDLAPFDLVYAFLSPVPMPRLMGKARAEMRPGTLLVSNSFAVPGASAEQVVDIADSRATRLYCYRL